MWQQETEKTKERWGDKEANQALRDYSWTAAAAIRRYQCRRVTGNPDADWLTWVDWLILRPSGNTVRCLVLGCGEGWLERALAQSPAVDHIDAVDVSPQAVATASDLAKEHGLENKISYSTCNLNHDELPPDTYDVVIAHSVLHHVEDLEFAYQQIDKTLKKGGILVINEYVGPKRFQFTETQLSYMNVVFPSIPRDLRVSARTGKVIEKVERPPVEVVAAIDPSEAIRSDEVLPASSDKFEIIHLVKCGGTILHQLLYEIAPNFDDDNQHHRGILDLLCTFEELLVDSGRIPSDFVFAIAQRRRDSDIIFTMPEKRAQNPSTEESGSPWILKEILPETAGFQPFLKHLNKRITGDPELEIFSWCLSRFKTPRFRLNNRRSALVVGRTEFSHQIATYFTKVETSRNSESRFDALFSLCDQSTRELGATEAVDKLAGRLNKNGNLMLLSHTRELGEMQTSRTRHAILSLAAGDPSGIDTAALKVPVSPTIPIAASLDHRVIRESIERRFEIRDFIPLGWSILHVLVPLYFQGHEKSAAAESIAHILCGIDETLSDAGVVDSEFLLVVAHKK